MNVLEDRIVLPLSLQSFFGEPGYCESTFFESRKHSRLRIRCKASMSIEVSLPCIVRTERHSLVYVKDISRGGLGIITHEQLFPEEKLLVVFQQREVRATVVRCRRIEHLCWECGVLITGFKNLEEEAVV